MKRELPDLFALTWVVALFHLFLFGELILIAARMLRTVGETDAVPIIYSRR